ncbi:hypothetical protein DFH09DRAFT_355483 [Mycena vulgaris]|nr:hypothetical protein DFH09DRAFT_355483 [Mycena vulgaris]
MQPTWRLGAIIRCPSNAEPKKSAETAVLPSVEHHVRGWTHYGTPIEETIINGWIRYKSHDVLYNSHHGLGIVIDSQVFCTGEAWIAQANHVFRCLRITSNYEDYAFVYSILFRITISAPPQTPPNGYLFLCPTLHCGPSSFQWPNCHAFWSLDPLGVERLSAQEVLALGFPAIELTTYVRGTSWDAKVYEGIHRFHQAKGFDPDSLDVSRHLGYPLYELSNDPGVPFACVDDDSDDDDSNGQGESEEDSKESRFEDSSERGEEFRQSDLHFSTPDSIIEDQKPEALSGSWEILIFLKGALIVFLA